MGYGKKNGKMLAFLLAAVLLLPSIPSVAYAVEGENGAVLTGQEAAAEETEAEDETGAREQEAPPTEDKSSGEDGGEKETGEKSPEADSAETGGQDEPADSGKAPDDDGDVSGAEEGSTGETGAEDAAEGAEGTEAEEPKEEAVAADVLPEQAESAAVETFAAEGGETSGSCGENVTWRFEDGVLTISGSGAMDYSGNAPWYEYHGNIKRVVIEEGVTTIYTGAFSWCNNLTSIELPLSVATIYASAFENCSSLTSIKLPSGVTTIAERTFYGCSSLTSIELPSSVSIIGQYAFDGCSSLVKIELPSNVTTIKAGAFWGCRSLANMELPSGITTIGYGFFAGCSSLTSIELPSGVTAIGEQAFDGCSNLKSIKLPSGVTTIGDWAFCACSSLKDIELPSGVTIIGGNAFIDCSSLTSIKLPSGVTTIEYRTFSDCSKLESIEMPSGISTIEQQAFYGCGSLTDVYYGGSESDWRVITIRDENEPLTSATLHCALNDSERDGLKWGLDANGVLTISGTGEMADYHEPDFPAPWSGPRDRIKTIVISQGVTSIGTFAFFGCANLTEITIPKSVVSIGDSAFSGCENLARVRFLGTKEQLENITVGADNEPFYKASRSWIEEGTVPDGKIQYLEDVYYYDTIAKTGVKTDLTWSWDYLEKNPSTYNESLAQMGLVLSAAIEGSSAELVDILMAKNGDMTNSLGCDGAVFDPTGSPGAAFAHRTVTYVSGNKGHVIFVVIRGTNDLYDGLNDLLSALGRSDWGSAGVYSKLGDYLADCRKSNKDMKPENTKFFVTGHSLGGACANIVAKKLSDEYGVNNVHAYTFGTPSPFGSEQENNCTNIHNFLCWDDHVPLWLLGTKYPWCGYGYYTWFYQDESPETEEGYRKLTGKRWQETYEENNGFLGLGLHAPSIYLAFLQSHPEFEPRAGVFHVYYMRAKCPVDIEVFNSANELVGRIINDEVDSASRVSGVVLTVVDGQKSVYFAKDDTYTVRITGTGEGMMMFTAASVDLNSGIVEEEKLFSNVRIADGKKMESHVGLYDEADSADAVKISDVGLHVINENGDHVAKVLSDQEATALGKEKGSEIPLDQIGEVLPGDIPADGKIPDGLWIAGVADSYAYTGAAIKPEIRVYDGKKKLQSGKDYTVSYKNNMKANDASNSSKAPAVVVRSKGNYAGTETAVFKIAAVSLNDDSVSVEDIITACNKKVQKKTPVVTYRGRKLAKNRDFTVSYPSAGTGAYKEAGTYEILLTAKAGGNFSGTRTVACTITDSILLGKANVKKIPDRMYTGEAIEPELTVTYKNKPLVKGTDYTVSYMDHTEIGTAKAVLTGIGKYAGTKTVSFRIAGTSLKGAVVSGIENRIFNGNDQEQNMTVTLKGRALEAGTDYEAVYAANRETGKASITIKGKGAYTGTIKKTFRIGKFDIAANKDGRITAEVKQETVPYAKGGVKPEVTVRFRTGDGVWRTLSEGKDYVLSYRNHMAVNDGSNANKQPEVTVKGKGNFSGTYGTTLRFQIAAQDLSRLTLAAQDKIYQNKKNSYSTKLSITDQNGKVLKAGTDYQKAFTYLYKKETEVSRADEEKVIRAAGTVVDKEDIIPAGTVLIVRAEAKEGGNYTGTLEGEYRITKSSIASVSVSVPKQVYTGQPITLEKSMIAVKMKGKKLDESQYEIVPDSYKNNVKKGTASVMIRGADNYGGIKTVKFTIRAKGFLWWWR